MFWSVTGLSIPVWNGMLRRVDGVNKVSSGARKQPIPQDDYVAECARIQREAAAKSATMPPIVDGLWASEGLSTTLALHPGPDNTLNDARIPHESLSVAHVGYGSAATESARFDPERLREIAETKSTPHYGDHMLEGVGSILRIYEPGVFNTMASTMGLIPPNPAPPPSREGFYRKFLDAFPLEVRRLIAHGYGRLICFSSMSVHAAIDEARTLPAGRASACVQGVGFAFAMMNSDDIARILESSGSLRDASVRAPFQAGLVYALVYAEWFAPGLLAAWRPSGKVESALVGHAAEESISNISRGYLLPFRLERPIVP